MGSKNNYCRREELYRQYFGSSVSVSREIVGLEPRIDIHVYPPQEPERDFYTLITNGMSEYSMPVPNLERARCELVFYAREAKDIYILLLRYLARVPLEDESKWIWHGSTMVNGGNPPKAYFADSEFRALGFVGAFIPPEAALPEDLRIKRTPVGLLWVIPLYLAECEFIRQHDVDTFLSLSATRKCEVAFDESRPCLVEPS